MSVRRPVSERMKLTRFVALVALLVVVALLVRTARTNRSEWEAPF